MQYTRGEIQDVYIHHEHAIREAGTFATIISSGMFESSAAVVRDIRESSRGKGIPGV
jgi:hypothetical protein